MSRLRVALIQLAADQDVAANVERAAALIREAGESKPGLIALPEMFHYRGQLAGFRESGVRRVHLEVTAQNNSAIRLYRRVGFTPVKVVFKAVEPEYSL